MSGRSEPTSRWLSEEAYRRSPFLSRVWARIQARAASVWRRELRGDRALVRVRPVIGPRGAAVPIEMHAADAANAVRRGAAERIPGEVYPPDFPRVARR
jgi:uncharacterized linocin/CFP29 family protein